jgi:hippurate hydrolase
VKILSLSILLLSILSGGFAFAQQTPQTIADAELPSLLTIYKDLHVHPELSGHEERTAAIVVKELRAVGCDVTENFGKYDKPNLKCYGVIGVMKNGEGATVLVRTDMDALPVKEETGLPYASKVTTKNDSGQEVCVMHACGHDAHIAAFIGTARALGQLKDQWAGQLFLWVNRRKRQLGALARCLRAGSTIDSANRISRSDFMITRKCRLATSA